MLTLSIEPPLHSCYQTLKTLKSLLPFIKDGIIHEENIPDMAEEILSRLKKDIWLVKIYPTDTVHLRETINKAKTSYRDKRIQNELELILESFLNTIELEDPVNKQIKNVCELLQTPRTYSVIEACLDELLTDLIHHGHSEEFLHKWVVRDIIEHEKDLLQQTSFEKLNNALIGSKSAKDFKVLLKTNANTRIPSSSFINFYESSTKLRKLTSYICHSCGSRNPVRSIDSRLRPAGMTEL